MSGPEMAAATAEARSNAFFIVETPLQSRDRWTPQRVANLYA
jgi:hypothetical protein